MLKAFSPHHWQVRRLSGSRCESYTCILAFAQYQLYLVGWWFGRKWFCGCGLQSYRASWELAHWPGLRRLLGAGQRAVCKEPLLLAEALLGRAKPVQELTVKVWGHDCYSDSLVQNVELLAHTSQPSFSVVWFARFRLCYRWFWYWFRSYRSFSMCFSHQRRLSGIFAGISGGYEQFRHLS